MSRLFFWRRRNAGTDSPPPAADAAAAGAGGGTNPAAQPPPPRADAPPADPAGATLPRRALALALQDARIAGPDATVPAAHMPLLIAASREFARVGTDASVTPHRPSLLPQLLEVVNDEDASLRALARIVAQDPQLTGDLLRTANSALYRVSSAPVESVERAAALLGTQGIRTLIAAALVRPLTQGGAAGGFGERTWELSLYGASAAEAWAARVQDADPFAAHLLVLLHGLGAVAVHRLLAAQYAAQAALAPDARAFAHALETNAAVTAARIAAHWGLSERTREALETQSSAAPVAQASPLARALAFGLAAGAATQLCRHGQLTEEAGGAALAATFPDAAFLPRVWDRLLRAYVRP